MSQYTMRLQAAIHTSCGRIGTYLLRKLDFNDDDVWGVRAHDGDAAHDTILHDNNASENKFFQAQSKLYMFLLESFQKHNFMEMQSSSYEAVRQRFIEGSFSAAFTPLAVDSITVRFLPYATLLYWVVQTRGRLLLHNSASNKAIEAYALS